MNTIQPKPLYKVGPDFAEFLGMDWKNQRSEVIRQLNLARELMYIHPDIEKMFDQNYMCINLECFPIGCHCLCDCDDDFYWGFTIPSCVDAIEKVWMNNEPLRGFSEFWEGRSGIGTAQTTTGWTLHGEETPLQRPLMKPDYLSVIGEIEDECKSVFIEIEDENGDKKKIEFELDCQLRESDIKAYKVLSVILPQDQKCPIKLYAGDRMLAEYGNDTCAPMFRRVKIEYDKCGKDGCNQVYVRYSREFRDICFDNDLVEVGSRVILREIAYYLRYGSGTTDANELNAANLNQINFIRLIAGALTKKRGGADEDPTGFRRNSYSHGLRGYDRRNRGAVKLRVGDPRGLRGKCGSNDGNLPENGCDKC